MKLELYGGCYDMFEEPKQAAVMMATIAISEEELSTALRVAYY